MEYFPTSFINTLDTVLSFLLFVYQCLATEPNFQPGPSQLLFPADHHVILGVH